MALRLCCDSGQGWEASQWPAHGRAKGGGADGERGTTRDEIGPASSNEAKPTLTGQTEPIVTQPIPHAKCSERQH